MSTSFSSSRRRFVRNASWLTAASLPLSGLTAARSIATKPAAKRPTVGHGNFQYKVDKKWGRLDRIAYPFQHCHEMVLDSRDRLVCSAVGRRFDVILYDKDGKLLNTWDYGLTEPHGFSTAGQGRDQTFWLTCPEQGRVLNLDLDGRIIRELAKPVDQIPNGKQYKPTETTVASDGSIFVADGYGTSQIFHYDEKGQLKHVFGGLDDFDCAHGIVLDERGDTPTLLITSRTGNNFQRWSLDGSKLMQRDLPGFWICRPVIHGENTYFAVIVTDSWYHYDGMVAVLDKDFNVVSLPGGSAPTDQTDFNEVKHDDQTFMSPHDVCVDEDENLYVPQWYSGRTAPVRLRRV